MGCGAGGVKILETLREDTPGGNPSGEGSLRGVSQGDQTSIPFPFCGYCRKVNHLEEVIAGIQRKARGGNVVFKLDMMKAYDRMMWPFLIKVLRSFGFGERWIVMVWRIISNVWFFVIVNGSICDFFKSAQEFRQGDPLSPALFIIGAEVLFRSLNQLVHQRGFQGFSVPRGCPTITHLGYADDVLIFSSATATFLHLTQEDGDPAGYGFQVVFLSHQVSGYPLYYGRRKKECFTGLCQAVHVLSALPVYLLMAASPPKSVFKEIEGRFSNFLWGEEGGLGLRRLEDIHRAFSIKLLWSFRSLSSLWATFMKAKYCAQLASRLDSVSDHLVADFIENGHWNLPLLQQWVPHGVVSEVVRVVPPVGQLPDLMVWRPCSSGQFTLWSAFHLVRRHANSSFMSRQIWHPVVPLKISFFLLRLLRGRIPVDCCLMKFGVHGPSRCGCCSSPVVKIVEHVFAMGEMASRVWHFFGDPVGISWVGSSFRVCMASWWYGKRGNRQLAFVHHILPLLICWHLWKFRNRMRYDGVRLGFARLCYLVLSDLLELFGLFLRQRRSFPADWVHFYAEISGWVPRVSYTLVRWSRPSGDALKLNTNGCTKGNPSVSGAGGILRDGGGSLLLAFSCYFGHATSLQAEVRALLFGVQLCVQRGFGRLDVELDSLVLVHILLGKASCPWGVYHEIQQLLELRGHFLRVSHCLRQANQVADALSNVGCAQGGEKIYTSSLALPPEARGAMRLDRVGVPSVRRMVHDRVDCRGFSSF
ncbi:uncharacterized protein LOC113750530 [Coffea eugenioides]|uniref:uncharacterized protein LOC113750530 n=1 Tax=Coffea eugenioides TaxID=49369 RepID=UPI000F615DF9|nr:uncharacterized protein LOC113750530 [Coffea eugenioides]